MIGLSTKRCVSLPTARGDEVVSDMNGSLSYSPGFFLHSRPYSGANVAKHSLSRQQLERQ